MAMQGPRMRHAGFQAHVWTKCDRCGAELPVDILINQKGLLVCRGCYDNLLVEERPAVIQEVLSDGEEFEDIVGAVRAEPTEIPEL